MASRKGVGDPASNDRELEEAIQHLVHLKEEHQPILLQVAEDAGIAPDTRKTLIEHLLEEEAEAVQRLADVRGQRGESERQAGTPTLTVGSLRREP